MRVHLFLHAILLSSKLHFMVCVFGDQSVFIIKTKCFTVRESSWVSGTKHMQAAKTQTLNLSIDLVACADPEGGGTGGLQNHKNIGFLFNTGPDPLKNHKATKPAFIVVPSSACQRNAISMTFRWRADDGPNKAVLGSSIPPSTKKEKKTL